MSLSKEQILNAPGLIVKEVEVPQLGGTVSIRELTVRQRTDIEAMHDRDNKPLVDDLYERVIAMSVLDDAGSLMFTTEEEIAELCKKRSQWKIDLFKKIISLNVIDAAAGEELIKNSGSGQSDDSHSA